MVCTTSIFQLMSVFLVSICQCGTCLFGRVTISGAVCQAFVHQLVEKCKVMWQFLSLFSSCWSVEAVFINTWAFNSSPCANERLLQYKGTYQQDRSYISAEARLADSDVHSHADPVLLALFQERCVRSCLWPLSSWKQTLRKPCEILPMATVMSKWSSSFMLRKPCAAFPCFAAGAPDPETLH